MRREKHLLTRPQLLSAAAWNRSRVTAHVLGRNEQLCHSLLSAAFVRKRLIGSAASQTSLSAFGTRMNET